MIWFIFLYIIPGITNSILFKDAFDSLAEEYQYDNVEYVYGLLCFLPVVNLFLCIYLVLCYVHEILRKD